jgi:hypothetical protein
MSRLKFQEEIPSDNDRNYETEEDEEEEGELSDREERDEDKIIEIEEKKLNYENVELEYDSESDQEIEVINKPLPVVDLKEYSGFLSKFLATKKTPQVPPPPIPIPLNDYILKEFALSEKKKSQKRRREEQDDEDEDEGEDSEREIIELNSSDDENQPTVIDLSRPVVTSHSLTLFNLPYNITPEEVCCPPLCVSLSALSLSLSLTCLSVDHQDRSRLWDSKCHSKANLR